MRRYRTRTTAWPAVADLMTALAVVGLAAALIVANTPSPPPPPCPDSADPDPCNAVDSLNVVIDSLSNRVSQLEESIDSLNAVIKVLRERIVGFVPCWPRQTDDGTPSYYRTYNVTVQGDRFSFGRHAHWNPGTDLRDTLPREILSVLDSFPRSAVSEEAVATFGATVTTALVRAYPSSDCELAVTINGGASVDDAGFLRRFRFFAVGR